MDVSLDPESAGTEAGNAKNGNEDSNDSIQQNENNFSSNKKDPNTMTCEDIRARLKLFQVKTKKSDKKSDLVAKYLEMIEPTATDKKKRKSDNNLGAGIKISKMDSASGDIPYENSESVNIDNITEKDKVVFTEEPSPELEKQSKKKPTKPKSKTRGGTQSNDIEVTIHQMKVPQLKSSLKSLGLSTVGVKSVLIKRLDDAHADQETKRLTDAPTNDDTKRVNAEGTKLMLTHDEKANEDISAINEVVITITQNEEKRAIPVSQTEVENIHVITNNASNGLLANKDKLSEESKEMNDTEDNGKPEEDKCNNVISKKLTNQKGRSGREAKFLSSDQYADMTDNLRLGSYDFGEQPVLVLNTSTLRNGVNFHIPKSILKDPAIPKDDLKRVLLESGLRRNEVAISCGLSAQKAFTPKNDGKDGTATAFLKEISPDFVNSEGLPNIIKSERTDRDAFTYALPHATFVTAHEVCDTMLKQTKSNELREVLQEIFNENRNIEEGQNRAVMMGLKYAMDKDIENKNEEEHNSSDLSDEDLHGSEGNEESENQMELQQKLLEILKLKPISKEDLLHEANHGESAKQEDIEHAVDTILRLKQAIFNKTSKKLEYVEDL